MIDIAKWLIGYALVPLDSIDMHPRQRRPDSRLISKIKAELDQGINRQEANKVILLLPGSTGLQDLVQKILVAGLQQEALQVPAGTTFLCIDGQHRIRAAKQRLEEVRLRGSSTIPTQTRCWWAEIYNGGMEASQNVEV